MLGAEDGHHQRQPNGHLGGGYKWTNPRGQLKFEQVLGSLFSSWDFDGNQTNGGAWAEHYLQWISNWDLDLTASFNPRTTNTRPAFSPAAAGG